MLLPLKFCYVYICLWDLKKSENWVLISRIIGSVLLANKNTNQQFESPFQYVRWDSPPFNREHKSRWIFLSHSYSVKNMILYYRYYIVYFSCLATVEKEGSWLSLQTAKMNTKRTKNGMRITKKHDIINVHQVKIAINNHQQGIFYQFPPTSNQFKFANIKMAALFILREKTAQLIFCRHPKIIVRTVLGTL